jgi:hypothetical protein
MQTLSTLKMKVLLTICCLLMPLATLASGQQSKLTLAQTKEAEQLLSALGYWTGPVDGRFDAGSRWALIAFQKWEHRPITGKLTLAELQAIRSSDRPIARDGEYEHVEVDVDRQVMLLVDDRGAVRVLPVSTGTEAPFVEEGQMSVAHTPRGRFVVYDKTYGWEGGQRGSVYYANYISGAVAIHGDLSVPLGPASHGCIRVPMFAAREVSKQLKLGTIVLVYDKLTFVSAKEWAEHPELKQAAMSSAEFADFTETGIKKARVKIIRS